MIRITYRNGENGIFMSNQKAFLTPWRKAFFKTQNHGI